MNPSSHTPPPRRWLLPPRPDGHRLPAHLSPAAAQLLLSRGIGDDTALARFLDPPGVPYPPDSLPGVDAAVPRLAAAARSRETVAVFGDFDVDGITGTAILSETLQRLGARVIPYVPDPVAEGHGMTPVAVERLISQGASLIVTVDSGVSNSAEVALANGKGTDVVITDHHVPPPQPPEAVAIVNPRMTGNRYPFPELCGAGIAYKLATALLTHMGQPDDPSLLELAALGTVADLVPLRDENRHIVQRGLDALPFTARPGLRALLRRINLANRPIRAEHVSFQIVPRLNASGRMAHPETSLNLLLTSDEREGESLTSQLEQYNDRRRDLTARSFDVAVAQVMATSPLPAIIITYDDVYTPGINGLVAGRLTEMFNRPAVALARADANHLVASARSVGDFSLIDALSQCDDLLVKYGGHQAAAGFTVRDENYAAVADRLIGIANAQMGLFGPEPSLEIHAEGTLDELLSPGMTELCSRLEPFGKENPTPRYLTRGARVTSAGYVGSNRQHLKLRVSSGDRSIDALAWNYAGDWSGYEAADIVFQMAEDNYRGERRPYLRVDDIRPAI